MFIELIKKRRSIRRFLDKPIEKEKIDQLIEAALRAPSSKGENPWEFIVVTDRELLQRLSLAKEHGSTFLKGAPLGIVVCADPKQCDVWVEDASIAAIFIHLAASSLGLGSCWIQIRLRRHNQEKSSNDYVAEQLQLPPHLQVEAIVAIGYPAEELPAHTQDELQYEKVHRDFYGRPYYKVAV